MIFVIFINHIIIIEHAGLRVFLLIKSYGKIYKDISKLNIIRKKTLKKKIVLAHSI